MIKSELYRILKSTKGKIIICLIFVMPFIDFLLHVYEDVIQYGDYDKLHFGLKRFLQPAFASFLCGSSVGSLLQNCFFWILPLYFLILYSDSYTTDVKYGYDICLISRVGRKKYFQIKFRLVFWLPFLLTLASFTFNFLCNIIAFHGGQNYRGFEQFYYTMDAWFIFGYKNPYIYYPIYMIADAYICALSSLLGMCCSILFKSRYTAYPAAFFMWLIQIILPFGAGRAIQPFTEYGLRYFISGLIFYTAEVMFIWSITYLLRIKKDDVS